MQKNLAFLLFLLIIQNFNAQQDILDTIPSSILKDNRFLSVHLPRTYNDSTAKRYPLIITLDAENLYYFTVANTEIYYDPDPDFQIIPETIVIGIKQNYKYGKTDNLIRGKDADYDPLTGLLTENSQKFKEFIYKELLPYLKSAYRINDFSAIIGHSLTGTFVSNLLLEDNPLIKAFVAISPNLPDMLIQEIKKKSNHLKSPQIYYISTGTFDLSDHMNSTKKFNAEGISEENFIYQYNFF